MTRFQMIVCYFITSLSTQAFSLEIDNMSAFLRGGGTTGQTLDLRFNVKNMISSDFSTEQPDQNTFKALLLQNLSVCYNTSECKRDSSQRIRYTEENASTIEGIIDGFIEVSSYTFNVDAADTNKYQGSASYKIGLTGVETFTVGSTLSYTYSDGRIFDVTIQKYTSVIEDPEGLTVSPQNQGIAVKWNKKDSVTYAGQNLKGAPVGMRAYLIPTSLADNSGNASFEGIMSGYNTESGSKTEEAYSCLLNVDNENDSCTFTCDNEKADALINSEKFIAAYPDVKTQETNDASTNTITFTGLTDTASKYAVILQYLPDGLRSGDYRACVVSSSIETFTYTQISGGEEPKLENPNCFIATAAYGSPLAPELKRLRWFRDQVLNSFALGRYFVERYYEYRPKLAETLKQSDLGKTMVRWILTPIVMLIASYQTAPASTVLALLGFISIVSLFMIRHRVLKN